jgi:acyl carrier protein
MKMESEILQFIQKELKSRGKNVELNRKTSILLSNLLDSLFLVDLIVFLEGKYPSMADRFTKATKSDLDTIEKILAFMGGKSS